VLNDVQSYAGVELPGMEARREVARIAQDELVMGFLSSGLLAGWRVSLETDGVRHAEFLQPVPDAAADIENAVAVQQGVAQREHEQDLRRVGSLFQEGANQTGSTLHG
jgi:hypothetical protein